MEDNKQNKNALFYSMLIATIKKMHITNVWVLVQGIFSEAIEYFLAYFKKHFEQPVCVIYEKLRFVTA